MASFIRYASSRELCVTVIVILLLFMPWMYVMGMNIQDIYQKRELVLVAIKLGLVLLGIKLGLILIAIKLVLVFVRVKLGLAS